MPPSTDHPQALPEGTALRRLTRSLAMLDAIFSPTWEFRRYSFNAHWNAGEELASMRDGSGDDWFLLFAAYGTVLKGFAHESGVASERTFPGRIIQHLPASFAPFLREPAFVLEAASFCLWREPADDGWSVVPPGGDRPWAARDGSADLLGTLDGDPRTYRAWAEDYYEREILLPGIQAIYAQQPLDAALLDAFEVETTVAELRADAAEIGYPTVANH